MTVSDAAVPRSLSVTCAGCSDDADDRHAFDLRDADVDGLTAVYACLNCGHSIHLDLDP